MTLTFRSLSLAVIVATSAFSMVAVQMAEAGGTKRQRSRDGIMRLGGPANGNGNGAINGNGTAPSFVGRAGGPSLRTPAEVRAFFDAQIANHNSNGL